jgi:hypothetical protein
VGKRRSRVWDFAPPVKQSFTALESGKAAVAQLHLKSYFGKTVEEA